MLPPSVFPLSSFSDERGKLSFCNELDFFQFKRFYIISPKIRNQVRAWQAHLREEKVFLPLKGKIKIVAVPIFDIESDHFGISKEFILDATSPELIHLPGGYANGFQFLDAEAELMIFSNFNLEESKEDDFRFEASKFYHW